MGCLDSYLRDDYNDGEYLSLVGQKFTAQVIGVYDSGIIMVSFKRFGKKQIRVVRMDGYDSLDLRPPRNIAHRREKKDAAIKAYDALIGMIKNPEQFVRIKFRGCDKHEHLSGTIYLENGLNVNNWMITHNYGTPHGRKRKRLPHKKQPIKDKTKQ